MNYIKKHIGICGILFAFIIITGCNDKKTQNNYYQDINLERNSPLPTDTATCIKLYEELIQFKDKPDFIQFGFAEISPYKEWYNKVENLSKKVGEQNTAYAMILGEIMTLANEYCSSRGKETKITQELKHRFSFLYTNHIENPTSSLDNSSNGTPIGKWLISDKLLNEEYTIEIFKKGNDYYSIEFGDVIRPLKKQGNKYYILDSPVNEYYIIKNGHLQLWDQHGNFTDKIGNITILK